MAILKPATGIMSGNTLDIYSIFRKSDGVIVAYVSSPDHEQIKSQYENDEFGVVQGRYDNKTKKVCLQTRGIMDIDEVSAKELEPLEFRWNKVRQQRNHKLDSFRWTVMPDSPLTEANKAEWLAYLKALQALTKDLVDPDEVVWPQQPEYVYAEE